MATREFDACSASASWIIEGIQYGQTSIIGQSGVVSQSGDAILSDSRGSSTENGLWVFKLVGVCMCCRNAIGFRMS